MKKITNALLFVTFFPMFAGKNTIKKRVSFDRSRNTIHEVSRHITDEDIAECKKMKKKATELLFFARQLSTIDDDKIAFLDDDDIVPVGRCSLTKEAKVCIATTAIAASGALLYFLLPAT